MPVTCIAMSRTCFTREVLPSRLRLRPAHTWASRSRQLDHSDCAVYEAAAVAYFLPLGLTTTRRAPFQLPMVIWSLPWP